jgi:hypothetical protein
MCFWTRGVKAGPERMTAAGCAVHAARAEINR